MISQYDIPTRRNCYVLVRGNCVNTHMQRHRYIVERRGRDLTEKHVTSTLRGGLELTKILHYTISHCFVSGKPNIKKFLKQYV